MESIHEKYSVGWSLGRFIGNDTCLCIQYFGVVHSVVQCTIQIYCICVCYITAIITALLFSFIIFALLLFFIWPQSCFFVFCWKRRLIICTHNKRETDNNTQIKNNQEQRSRKNRTKKKSKIITKKFDVQFQWENEIDATSKKM